MSRVPEHLSLRAAVPRGLTPAEISLFASGLQVSAAALSFPASPASLFGCPGRVLSRALSASAGFFLEAQERQSGQPPLTFPPCHCGVGASWSHSRLLL